MATLHPMLVHFPIALLLFGVIADLVRAVGGDRYSWCATLGIWGTTAGLLMMLPAIGTGLLAHTFQPAPDLQVQDLINLHERLSYGLLILFGVLIAWRWDARGDDQSAMPVAYLTCAALGAICVIVIGAIGGRLVYRHGMGVTLPPTPPGVSAPAESTGP